MIWTIDEFMGISDWWTFRDFCEERDVYPDCVDVDNLVDADWLGQMIADWANHSRWQDICRALSNLGWNGDNGEVLSFDGDEVTELTSYDLEDAKEEVLQILHENGEYLDGEEDDSDDDDDDLDDGSCNEEDELEFDSDAFMSIVCGGCVNET